MIRIMGIMQVANDPITKRRQEKVSTKAASKNAAINFIAVRMAIRLETVVIKPV